MAIQNLLFIDANIWLDFYRARNDTGLQLLQHAEAVSARLVVSYQLESEFKKNRQNAILEGMQELKVPSQISRPGIFSDAKAVKMMANDLKAAERRMKNLRRRLSRALEKPGLHDPVYKVCQRIFHKTDSLNLSRDNPIRKVIRRRAFRRFLHGCPPRKKNDTSIGDAINWEWMVHCATQEKSGLVIVTRDSDYGVTVDDKSYINDHLRQEFSERVSRKRSLILCSRLSEALKLFQVKVSPQEEAAEKQLASALKQLEQVGVGPALELSSALKKLDLSTAAVGLQTQLENINLDRFATALTNLSVRLQDLKFLGVLDPAQRKKTEVSPSSTTPTAPSEKPDSG